MHVSIKRKQPSYFEERLAGLDDGECAIQVDFAENNCCAYLMALSGTTTIHPMDRR